MYAYLDRPVASLAAVDRLVLDAMRSWAMAVAHGRDPVASIAARLPLLARAGGIDALDAAMTLLDSPDAAPISLQRPCHDRVEEDEAVLLGIVALVAANARAAAVDALAAIAGAPAAHRAARHLAAFRNRLIPALQR